MKFLEQYNIVRTLVTERKDKERIGEAYSIVKKYLTDLVELLMFNHGEDIDDEIEELNNKTFDGVSFIIPKNLEQLKEFREEYDLDEAHGWYDESEDVIYITNWFLVEMLELIKELDDSPRRRKIIKNLYREFLSDATILHEVIHYLDTQFGNFTDNITDEYYEDDEVYVNSTWEVNAFFLEGLFKVLLEIADLDITTFQDFVKVMYGKLDEGFVDNMSEDTRKRIVKRMWAFYDSELRD